jgi:hypothetical protein
VHSDEPPPYEERPAIPAGRRPAVPVRTTDEELEGIAFDEDAPDVTILEQTSINGPPVSHVVVRTNDVFEALEKLKHLCSMPAATLPGGRAPGVIQPPLGGFPPIHQLSSAHAHLAVSPEQKHVWDDFPFGILLKLFNPSTVDRRAAVQEIRDFLIKLTSQEDWEVIVHRIRHASFEDPLYGEGEHDDVANHSPAKNLNSGMVISLSCSHCNSASHSYHNCKFPKIPGWEYGRAIPPPRAANGRQGRGRGD